MFSRLTDYQLSTYTSTDTSYLTVANAQIFLAFRDGDLQVETIPPHRKILYATMVIAVLGAIAISFYAIDQATLFYLFKNQAQKDFEVVEKIIANHKPFDAPARKNHSYTLAFPHSALACVAPVLI